jgi:LysR family transcriptional regulator, regulator for bpeEF and oprC
VRHISDRELFDGVTFFVAVAESLSFRQAAAHCGVTPAAVSKAILALENRLGTALFIRTSRAVSLTPKGAKFLKKCSEAVGVLRTAHDEAQESLGVEGLLRVSLSTIISAALAPALSGFFSRHPQARLLLDATNNVARFPTDNIDLALRLGPLTNSSLVTTTVARTRWLTVASPAFVAAYGMPRTLAELAALPAALFVRNDGRTRAWLFRQGDRDANVSPTRVVLQVTNGRDLLPAAQSGLCAVQVLHFMATPSFKEGQLIELLPEFASEGPTLQAVSTKAVARTPLAKAFTAFAAQVFRNASPSIDALPRNPSRQYTSP